MVKKPILSKKKDIHTGQGKSLALFYLSGHKKGLTQGYFLGIITGATLVMLIILWLEYFSL